MTDQEARDEAALRGRWSNGDPVHIITDGVDRWVAPNHNGATWIPETAKAPAPFDRYAEHDRVKRDGGTCSCGATYPAPQEARDDEREAALRTIESLHPTASIAVGSATHGGPTQYSEGCGLHGVWCRDWQRTRKAVEALREFLDAHPEPEITDEMVERARKQLVIGNLFIDPFEIRLALEAALNPKEDR